MKGVAVGRTTIGDVQGGLGFYHYRQHDATELARSRSFEDVVAHVLDGQLPDTRAASIAARRRLGDARVVPTEVLDALGSIVAVDAVRPPAVPLAGLRSALSLLAAAWDLAPLMDLDEARRHDDVLRLCAATPTLVAALHRVRSGRAPIDPDPDAGVAHDYLRMLHGVDPDEHAVRALEVYLSSTIDHGFNASTFTARVVASTGADAGSAMVAALGALSGPLHGGAPSRALEMLDRIDGPDVDSIDAVVVPMIERGERIMGFGHAVYRTEDPRSVLLGAAADDLGARSATAARRVRTARAVESRIVELLARHKPDRVLRTNVEYYAAVVMELCGVPAELFSSTFACSRVVGWGAHVLEQAELRTIIRPAATYVGPEAPQPVPPLVDGPD
ncbi:MAG: citrate/2-methylcitrate synthase [Microthrixaceae bacterium]